MIQQVYDAEYEKKLAEIFDQFMPEKRYDAHFHICKDYALKTGYTGDPYDQYTEFMQKYLCRKIAGGLVMASPSTKHTPEMLDSENEYILDLAKREKLEVGLLMMPSYTAEKTEKMMSAHPEIKALKPYLTYSTAKDIYESDIFEFAPEWMWQYAHEREMPVILHLSHYQNMLYDENNVRDLRYISKKYPKAKIVLAHCAMGHHLQKFKWGLDAITDLKNIWFDCSGSAEALTIYYAIKAFGAERMLYGDDFNHGATPGRIVSFGSNFFGFHPYFITNTEEVPDYRYQPMDNARECLLALVEACELLKPSKSDINKIFYENAVNIYK